MTRQSCLESDCQCDELPSLVQCLSQEYLNARLQCLSTGHSLGGALATLAAVEVAQEQDLPGVKCITFGAPRTGTLQLLKPCGG